MTERKKLLEAIAHYTSRTGLGLGPIRAALIDMDGTLYESMSWHAKAWHRLMKEYGVEIDMDEFYTFEGMTGHDTINLLFKRAFNREVSPEESKNLYAKKSQYFIENNNASVMPGAKRMVDTFLSEGITTILVTGSGQTSLINRLEEDFPGAFPVGRRITSRDVTKGKPSPEPYLKALELAGVKPNEGIVIENAPLGALSGVNAGVFTIAVNTGPIPRKDLEASGADLVLDSMTECAEMLSRLLLLVN